MASPAQIPNPTHLPNPIVPGIAYFALVFTLGAALGTVRTIFVPDTPGSGRLQGVLIELPFMLLASWCVCRFVVRRFGVASTIAARAVMGGLALALLLLAELGVGALLVGRTATQHVALYTDASYALGLVAQIAFALMPLLLLHHRRWR